MLSWLSIWQLQLTTLKQLAWWWIRTKRWPLFKVETKQHLAPKRSKWSITPTCRGFLLSICYHFRKLPTQSLGLSYFDWSSDTWFSPTKSFKTFWKRVFRSMQVMKRGHCYMTPLQAMHVFRGIQFASSLISPKWVLPRKLIYPPFSMDGWKMKILLEMVPFLGILVFAWVISRMIADELNELGETPHRQVTKKLQQSMATAIPGQASRVSPQNATLFRESGLSKALLGDDGG